MGYLFSACVFLMPFGAKSPAGTWWWSEADIKGCCFTLYHLPQTPYFFFLKGIFQDLPRNRKYPSAGGSCSPALATLAALLWALNEKAHKQEALLALASLMRPRRTGDWGCQRRRGGAGPVSLPQLLAASFGCHGRYLTASELGEVAQTTPAPGSHCMDPSTHHLPRLLAPFTAACHSN